MLICFRDRRMLVRTYMPAYMFMLIVYGYAYVFCMCMYVFTHVSYVCIYVCMYVCMCLGHSGSSVVKARHIARAPGA